MERFVCPPPTQQFDDIWEQCPGDICQTTASETRGAGLRLQNSSVAHWIAMIKFRFLKNNSSCQEMLKAWFVYLYTHTIYIILHWCSGEYSSVCKSSLLHVPNFLKIYFYRSKMNTIKETFDKVPCKIGSNNVSCYGVTWKILPETNQQTDDSRIG